MTQGAGRLTRSARLGRERRPLRAFGLERKNIDDDYDVKGGVLYGYLQRLFESRR